jgi:hypothetical protein
MNYHSNHTLGRHTIFLYTFYHKEVMQYYGMENYWAEVDVRYFHYITSSTLVL